MSGGHLKFRDYFGHARRHPGLDPYVYLAFAKQHGPGEIWSEYLDRVVTEAALTPFDLVFIDGRDWELLPGDAAGKTVVHLIQDFRHGDSDDPRFTFLSRQALRICISAELADAVRPHVRGPLTVIENGLDSRLFAPGQKEPQSVTVWARKDRDLGKAIQRALRAAGAQVMLLTKPLPRREFAELLSRSEVFVGLTKEREGFYLPALEAMASACAVVCADAIGNRGFCIDGETCRIARHGDPADHVRLVEELLADGEQRGLLKERSRDLVNRYTLQREQAQFHHALEEHVLNKSSVR
jgi:glycosyltransferase involved in cell wall biosynthesis